MPTFIRRSPSGPLSTVGVDQTSDSVENTSSVPGATLTDALDALDAEIAELETVTFTDDFLGGPDGTITAPTEGRFGQLGWSFVSSGAGTLSRPTDQEYMGAYAVTSPASVRTGLTLAPDSAQASITLASSQFSFLEFLVCPNIDDAASGGAFRCGIGMVFTEASMGQNAIFIEVNRGVSDNWRLVGRVATVNVVVTSSIPFAPHTLTRVRLDRNVTTGAWTGSINGVAFGSLTSAQVSGTRMIAGVQVESGAGGPQAMSIDRYSVGVRTPLF